MDDAYNVKAFKRLCSTPERHVWLLSAQAGSTTWQNSHAPCQQTCTTYESHITSHYCQNNKNHQKLVNVAKKLFLGRLMQYGCNFYPDWSVWKISVQDISSWLFYWQHPDFFMTPVHKKPGTLRSAGHSGYSGQKCRITGTTQSFTEILFFSRTGFI